MGTRFGVQPPVHSETPRASLGYRLNRDSGPPRIPTAGPEPAHPHRCSPLSWNSGESASSSLRIAVAGSTVVALDSRNSHGASKQRCRCVIDTPFRSRHRHPTSRSPPSVLGWGCRTLRDQPAPLTSLGWSTGGAAESCLRRVQNRPARRELCQLAPPFPRGYDGVEATQDVDPDRKDPVLMESSARSAATKAKYADELFPATREASPCISFIVFFQTDCSGERKGIVRIDLQEQG